MTAFKGLGTYGDAVGVVTPLDHKLAQAAQVAKTTTPLVVRPGLFYSGATTIVSGTAGMAYSVAAYQCVTQRSAGAGVVFGGNDGTLSVPTTAAPGSNSRIDVVYHWHKEFSLDGGDSNPVIGVVQGTAAASPTVPSLAAFPGAIELARITVPAGVTATNSGTTISQVAPFTTVDGGRVPFRNKTAMDLWTTAVTLQRAYAIDTGIEYLWDGTAWVSTDPVWTTWATAPTNITVGTGGLASTKQRYKVVGGRIFFDCKYVLGTSGASVGTGPVINLPFPVMKPTTRFAQLGGSGGLYDASTTAAETLAVPRLNGTADNQVLLNTFNGAYVGITATAPWTWAAGDEIAVQFWADLP